MQTRSARLFIISVIAAILSIYEIIARVIASLPSSDISKPPVFLMLDYVFWFWVILAWIFAYSIIKNYITLRSNNEVVSADNAYETRSS